MKGSKFSNQEKNRSYKLRIIDWLDDKLSKVEIEFKTLEEAIEASKSKIGKIKIFSNSGELLHSAHNECRENNRHVHHKNHRPKYNNHNDDDDDDSYA